MDFSQIQLIYSAEGNANLVVALPQLKKVLRLPKADISSTRRDSRCDDQDQDEDENVNVNVNENENENEHENHHHHKRQQQQEKQEKRWWKQQQHHQQNHNQKLPPNAYDGANPNGIVTTLDTDLAQGAGSTDDVEDRDAAVHPEDLVAFVSVVARFIGKEYVNIPEVVNITSEVDRRRINDFCRPFRPAHRLDKEFCGQFGLILPDATFLPETLLVPDLQQQLTPGDTFAVDIKPKQGWMLQDIGVDAGGGVSGPAAAPRTSFFNPFNLKASTRCRYCAMQFSKVRSRKVTRLSEYCPIDMFSGKPSAMRKSLKALLECPQNNLRIFRNGQLMYGDHEGSISLDELKMEIFNGDLTMLQDLIINCLLRNYSEQDESEPTNVLQRILNIQLLAKNYMRQASSTTPTTSSSTRKTYKWVKKFLSRPPETKLGDLTPLEQYLLAATFLDCSIIVAFKEMHLSTSNEISTHPNVIHLRERTFLTKVTVLDLDPKPDNHFEKFIKNTNKAYECAEEHK